MRGDDARSPAAEHANLLKELVMTAGSLMPRTLVMLFWTSLVQLACRRSRAAAQCSERQLRKPEHHRGQG